MISYPDVFSYVKAEEAGFTLPVDVLGWQWSMTEHIKKSFYYKHGRQITGNSTLKPVKNITKPILNLQYRTEDIDVKDLTDNLGRPLSEIFLTIIKDTFKTSITLEVIDKALLVRSIPLRALFNCFTILFFLLIMTRISS
jgi:hypothetical protein